MFVLAFDCYCKRAIAIDADVGVVVLDTARLHAESQRLIKFISVLRQDQKILSDGCGKILHVPSLLSCDLTQ